MSIETIRFRNDTAMRKRFFHEAAMSHPAKMHGGLFLDIMERYTKPGDTILDPMGGIGTALLATMYGRSVIINELESHFLETIPKSWAKIQRNGPALGYTLGEVLILQGDARHLPIGSADHIVTSPPFEEAQSGGGIAIKGHYDDPKLADRAYSRRNITRPSAIITSPPYEGVADSTKNTNTNDAARGYPTRPMSYSPVDAVISSPPYEGSIQGAHDGIDWSQQADGRKKQEPHGVGAHPWSYSRPVYEKAKAKVQSGKYTGVRPDVWTSPTNIAAQGYLDGYSGQSENIGNMRGDAYWDAMRFCYQECFRVLKPGGIMALVLKGFTREGKYVDLPAQTVEKVESLGFRLFDHWKRELWSLSFWRILQKRRDPAAFDERLNFEEVLAFKKPVEAPSSSLQR